MTAIIPILVSQRLLLSVAGSYGSPRPPREPRNWDWLAFVALAITFVMLATIIIVIAAV